MNRRITLKRLSYLFMSVTDRECYSCQSKKAYVDKRGIEHWRMVDGGYWCSNCYQKHFTNKHRNPVTTLKWHKHNNNRMINFLKTRVYLTWNFRKHVCAWCGCKSEMTDMHHLVYWPCMPWVSMIELCRKCHTKTKSI